MTLDNEIQESASEARKRSKAGSRTFGWTLFLLILLVVVYVVSHAITLQSYGHVHYEAADVVGARQDLLVTVEILEEQVETPTAIAKPAIEALLGSLEQSVLAAETQDAVNDLFEAATRDLTELGIHEEISPKILEVAGKKADEFVSAAEGRKEAAKQQFLAELESAQEWILDALGAPELLRRVEQLQETVVELGYGPDSKVSKTLDEIAGELAAERPNRRLVAHMLQQVADEIRGGQSPFWSHPVLQWLEVMAWSLAGMLVVRLWIIGKYMAVGEYQPKWNWWWWAKIIQAPLLAVGVVLALSYLELGLVSGETLGLKISLRGQPIEFVVAVAFVLGLFSDRAYDLLDRLADRILPTRSSSDRGENKESGRGGAGSGGQG